jgi:hypothetical protein
MRVYDLGPSLLEPFEIGALLYAVLAFPAEHEQGDLAKAAEALCADVIRLTGEARPTEAANCMSAFPGYAQIDARESRRRLRTFNRRLDDRRIASRMSLGFFQQGWTGRPPELPAGMKRLSLNQLSELVLSESRESVPENVEKRAWRESLPVIHIAAAYQWAVRAASAAGRPLSLDLQELEVHQFIVALARMHEELVLADSRFGIAPEKLVRLRWVD